MLLAAALTGFSRVYIGEHWPVDVLGAVVAGAAALGIAYFSWGVLEPVWNPVIDMAEKIEEEIIGKLDS
jgi:undecaprenyl-diphosphatase